MLLKKGRIVLGLLFIGMMTTAIFVFNRLVNFFSLKNPVLSTEEGRFYEWRFGSVFYTKKGQGRPLLLIHDLTPFRSGHDWHLLESQLAKSHTVYTLDLLGCGRSDKPAITYTSFLYVQLMTDFLRNVVANPTQIIGAGASSIFIVEACHYDNTFMDNIFLINPKPLQAPSGPSNKRNQLLRQLLAMPLLGTFLYNLSINTVTLKNLLKKKSFYDPRKVTDFTLKAYIEGSQIKKTEGKFLYACITSWLTHSNLSHSLARINTRLYILSSQGLSNNLEVAKAYQKHLPSIEIISLEKSNYLPQLETPEELLEQLEGLL